MGYGKLKIKGKKNPGRNHVLGGGPGEGGD